jgi:hypothetical protein
MEDMKTVVAAYAEFSQAQQAVEALLLRKYDRADISVVAGEARRSPGAGGDIPRDEESNEGGIRRPGTVGASGMLGLIAGVSALTLPGVGPILAAGPMIGLLTGATAAAVTDGHGVAGLVDALMKTGVTEDDARDYTNFIRDGGALVLVRAARHHAADIAALLENLGHVDIERVRRRAVPGDYPEGGLGGDRSAAR